MILTEQLYKNLNRPYYHGSSTGRIESIYKRFNCFYITTKLIYAANYALSEDQNIGKVYEFGLKENLNIFNAKSKQDIFKLKLFIRKNRPDWKNDWYWKGLESEDWSYIFSNTEKISREDFIQCIQEIGYDGYFNFEWTENYKNQNDVQFSLEKELENSPGLGIFDISKLKQLAIYGYEDLFQFESFRNLHSQEIENLKSHINTLYKSHIPEDELTNLGIYYAIERLKFVSENDVKKVVTDIKNYEETAVARLYRHRFQECLQKGSIEVDRIGKLKLNDYYMFCEYNSEGLLFNFFRKLFSS